MKRKTCIFKNVAMLFVVIGLFAVFVGCNDNNDEVGPLRQEVQTLKADLVNLQNANSAERIKTLEDWQSEAKETLGNLPAEATPEEKEAAKKNLIDAVFAAETFKTYKSKVDSIINNARTKEDLDKVKDLVDGEGEKADVLSRLSAIETVLKIKKDEDGKSEFKVFGEYLKETDFADKFKTQLAAEGGEFKSLKDEFEKLVNREDLELPKALKTKFEKLLENVGLDGERTISAILGSRLTSIVLMPEYVGHYYGDPVVMFSPVTTPCNDTPIDPKVRVKYMVSPSTVKASDIDVNNLKVVYNDPAYVRENHAKTQAEKVDPKAKFVSLVDGILTVEVSLNAKETWAAKRSVRKMDQIMLQVPAKKGEFVVSSDWVKVIVEPISDYYLGKKVGSNDFLRLPTTLQGAKNYAAVVDLEYNETLDLNTVVKTIAFDNVLSNEAYGFNYSYDLKDEQGNDIVYELGDNDTDQQQFIKLVGSKVSTKVYSIDGANPASVDRTPIVHVMLKSDKCDQVLKEAFIKINIVKTKGIQVDPVDFTKGDVVASCNEFDREIRTQEMNEKFYAATGLSKTEFHRNYTLYTNVDLDNDGTIDGVGTVTAKPDNGSRESHNLVWTVSSIDQWNALGTGDNAVSEKEISKVVEYRSSSNVIRVTFKAKIKRPSIDLSNVKLDNYWSPNKQYARFNIAVPAQNSTNSNLAVIKTDIDNVFNNTEKNGDIVIRGWDDEYTYNYSFVERQSYTEVPVEGTKEVIKLYGNDNMLYAQRYNTEIRSNVNAPEVVAEISANNIIEYKQTDLAKYLLNIAPESMKVDLQLNAFDNCGHEIESKISNGKNVFTVHFLRPINVEPKSPKNFVDGVDAGKAGSFLKITDIVVLSDWRRNITNNENFNFEPNNKNYYKYYGVTSIDIDENNIKVEELKADGVSVKDKPASINVKQEGTVNVDTYDFGKVTYSNNNSTLNREFKLIIPVTVTYKWGKVKTTVKVDVKPTSQASRKRVK